MQVGVKTAAVNINVGKRKKRSQMTEMFTKEGRILEVEEDVDRLCMVDYEKGLAFLISAKNQVTNERGEWIQALGEDSMLPLGIVEEWTPEELEVLEDVRDQIFHEAHEAAKIEQYEKGRRDKWADTILWMIIIPSVVLLLIYAGNKFF